MRNLVAKVQQDMIKLQDTLQKEGNDLLEKIKHLELIDSIEHKKAELEKLLHAKIKKFEPAYSQFLLDMRRNAKKAGIDITKIEKNLKEKAGQAKTTLKKKTKSGSKAKSTVRKKKASSVTTKKKTTKKTSSEVKTAKKKTVKKASSVKKTSAKKKTGQK